MPQAPDDALQLLGPCVAGFQCQVDYLSPQEKIVCGEGDGEPSCVKFPSKDDLLFL